MANVPNRLLLLFEERVLPLGREENERSIQAEILQVRAAELLTFTDMAPHVRNNLIELFPRREIHTARWIIGADAYAGQDYLFHTDYPAFFAKIGHSLKEAFLSRLTHAAAEDHCFYDFVWLDSPPDDVTFHSLMREAEDALKARRFG